MPDLVQTGTFFLIRNKKINLRYAHLRLIQSD